MANVHPFRPLHYDLGEGDWSDLLSPPYDILDEEETEELRSRDAHNSVRLTLPVASEPHERAGERLRRWVREGVLSRSPGESLYVYEQEFEHEGGTRTRTGVFGALDLVPLDRGDVVPHEKTHRGPKEDRLSLMEATRAQLSPVFLVAPDPEGEVQRALSEAEPDRIVGRARTPDGQVHRLGELSGGSGGDRLSEVLSRRSLLIADGHHRYETARTLQERHPDWPGADRVLACVVGQRDLGLVVGPTHRSLSLRPPGSGWRDVLESTFELRPETQVRTPSDAEARAEGADPPGAMVLWSRGEVARLLVPRPEALADHGLDDEEGGVPSLVFSRLVLGAALGIDEQEARNRAALSYHRDPEGAADAAGEQGAAFYLPSPTVDAVWSAARARRRLPPKTTYFWPKLPTGLLFRELAPLG